MSKLPDREEQILRVHAAFIHMVVFSLLDAQKKPELEQHLKTAEENGWSDLVKTIRLIEQGRKDELVLANLDEEDTVIARAILLGLQNPQSLPELRQEADPQVASSGLAELIRAASSGNTNALQILGDMAGQMANAGGSMAKLGVSIKKMLDGERDPDRLSEGMDEAGRNLIESILKDLEQTVLH